MARVDIAMLRASQRFAKQEYDKQVLASAGPSSSDFGDAGPPYWNRQAWDGFRAQYGFYPFSASELPPSFAGAPDWVYELMALRKPPVTVAHES